MGKTVKKLWPFMWADYKTAESYLERMASKGLMLKSLENFVYAGFGYLAVYEKTKPQKRKFCIDGFKGSLEEAERYITMAEDAGWEGITADYGILVFASKEGESPVPMQTDWHNEYRQIRKSFWKFDIPLGICTLLIFAFFAKIESLPGETFFSEFNIALVYIIAFFIFSLAGLLRAVTFYIRSEIAIRRDVPLNPVGEKRARLWGSLHSLTGICVALIMLGRVVSYLYTGIFSGSIVKTIFCITLAVSFVGFFVLARFGERWEKKYVTALMQVFLILILICIVANWTLGCEITVEG